jgi:ribosome-binding ATPase YchF (GTP1/OBG family)
MDKLIEILRKETESLRVQYLQMTEESARNLFEQCEKRSKWKEIDWCEFLGLKPEVKNPNTQIQFFGFPKGFYNTRASRDLHKNQTEIRIILNQGLEKFIEKELKRAKIHYENSIEKLAKRIEQKNLNQDKLTAVTSHIGVNINTILTDGEKTVRAFTIIASGSVQRPHYRYLIK